MAQSLIKIAFTDTLRIDSEIQFGIAAASNPTNQSGVYSRVRMTFYNSYELPSTRPLGAIPLNVQNIGETTDGIIAAEKFATYFNLDYNRGGRYSVTVNGPTVYIKLIDEAYIFIDPLIQNATYLISNNVAVPSITIISSAITQSASSPCSLVDLQVTTDNQFVKVTTNNVGGAVTPATVYNRSIVRGVQYKIALFNATDAVARYPASGFLNIPILSLTNFDITPAITFNDGSIRVTVNNPSILSYEYSINDADWFTTGYFTGLVAGDYTIYIRDLYNGTLLGCKINTTVTISDTTIRTIKPFIEISKANPISFIKRQDPDNTTIFQNNSNSFSHEQKNNYLYCDQILFQVDDNSKVQFKTSYQTINVTLRNSNEDEVIIPTNQLTDNIDKFKSMDAILEAYNSTQVLVYFTVGNVYDVTETEIDTYELNGGLPEFAIVGGLVEVGGYGVLEIKDIIYIDSIDKNCMVFDIVYDDAIASQIIVKSEYNLLKYNVFDFSIDWSLYGEETYDVLIQFTDTDFDAVDYQSENILIKQYHENTVAIEYFNTNNRDIFYKYDIKHFIRVPIAQIEPLIKDEVNSSISDNSVYVIKSTLNDGNSFLFDEMTRGMALKVAIALSCEFVYIDGLGYAKTEGFELEPIPNTNLVLLKASMLKTGIGYNTIDDYITGEDVELQDFNIPNFNTEGLELLLAKPTNFIKK